MRALGSVKVVDYENTDSIAQRTIAGFELDDLSQFELIMLPQIFLSFSTLCVLFLPLATKIQRRVN